MRILRDLGKAKKIVKDKYAARRLLAEEEIRESERKYRELYETTKDGIAATDLEGNIIECNQAFLDMIGYSMAKIRNKNILNITPKKWHKLVAKIVDEIKARGYSDEFETEYIKKDGTVSYISVRAWLKKDREGKPTGMWVIVRDITERKEAEEALRKGEEEFRLPFESAKDAIIWADPKTGLITNCNKAAEILLEKKRGEIVGRHQTMIHPQHKARYYANMFKTHIKQKGAVDAEAEVITKSGKSKPVHITSTVTLVGGKPIIQGIFRDITERKRAEDEKGKILHVLGGYVKELDCLYEMAKMVEIPGISLEGIYQETADVMPLAWQYPDITCARIIVEGQEFKTTNFRETKWKQVADVKVVGKKVGVVEVYYLEEKPEIDEGPFLKEERNLIEAITERLGGITERKRAEEAFTKSEERYRRLLEYSGSAMVIIEKDKTISFVNKEFQKLSGYSKKDIIGRSFLDLIHKKYKKKMAEYHEERRKNGKAPITYEFEAFDKKGGRKTIEVTVAMVPGTGRSTAALRDMTERKKLEEELKQMTKELRKLRGGISSFVSTS